VTMSGCTVVALEGSHGSGKSTLAHALVTHYKARSINAALVSETARRSAFVEAAVIHGAGSFSLEAELQLFGAHISEEQLTARYHELVICDKTLANIVGYARLLSAEEQRSEEILAAMSGLAAAYSPFYDCVIYMSQLYDPSQTKDQYRPADRAFQKHADRYIRAACEDTGIAMADLPQGMDFESQVSWAAAQIDRVLR
jgi:predicted ATPase